MIAAGRNRPLLGQYGPAPENFRRIRGTLHSHPRRLGFRLRLGARNQARLVLADRPPATWHPGPAIPGNDLSSGRRGRRRAPFISVGHVQLIAIGPTPRAAFAVSCKRLSVPLRWVG